MRLRAPLALFHYETKRTCVADVWGSFFKCIITIPPPPRSTALLPPLNPLDAVTDPFFLSLQTVFHLFLTCFSSINIHLLLCFQVKNKLFKVDSFLITVVFVIET